LASENVIYYIVYSKIIIMARLDIERQLELEPKRMAYAKHQIEAKGYKVTEVSNSKLIFEFMGHYVYFFPYSGWHSGSTIKDGRGLKKLLRQI
jgi:hypothetical protein